MRIEQIHSFLVYPAKAVAEPPAVSGTAVLKHGSLYEMLKRVFERASAECDVEVVFGPDTHGKQNNPCRDELEAYARKPSLTAGRAIAERLQNVTTKRSGLGLLFLVKGVDHNAQETLVISRFPADQGVVATERASALTVEFIERVFMKNAKAYKSAHFATRSLAGGFADGRAVDRQLSGPRDLSEYWIREFLLCELRTTSAAGTRRLAEALRAAVRSSSETALKQELVAAARLMRGQDGYTRSPQTIISRLGLSESAQVALMQNYARPELMAESFRFDKDEFSRHVGFRAVELNNGAMLVAEDYRFDKIFTVQRVSEATVRYTTEGQVIGQTLRKSK